METSDFKDYSLSSYEPVRVVVPDFSPATAEVAAEMRRVAERHASSRRIERNIVQPGDCVRVNIKTCENDSPYPGLTRDGIDITLGIGMMPQDFEAALIGRGTGESFSVTYMMEGQTATPEAEENQCTGSDKQLKGIELVSQVQVIELREQVLPEINDEWVASHIALSGSVAEFREKTAAKLAAKKRQAFLKTLPYQVTSELGSRLEQDIPDDVVEMLTKQMAAEFQRFLAEHELDLDAYLASQRTTAEEQEQQMREDALERITQDVALMAYARYHNIISTNEDVDALLSQPTPEKTREARSQAIQAGELRQLQDLALRAKTSEFATTHAQYVKPNGDPDEEFAQAVAHWAEKQQAARSHRVAKPMQIAS
jgi:FKBP-type peptidyl-prolyl cis-trans isomerase (trigger factor)